MAVSVELLNTTLADLKGPLVSAFLQNVPTFRALEKKGRISADGGTLIERPIMSGSPARGTGIFNGDQVDKYLGRIFSQPGRTNDFRRLPHIEILNGNSKRA